MYQCLKLYLGNTLQEQTWATLSRRYRREQPGALKPLDETEEGKEVIEVTASTLFILAP